MQEDKLRYLLGQRLYGRQTAAEEEELYTLLQHEENEALFLEVLTELMLEAPDRIPYDAAQWQPVQERILAVDAVTPVVPLRRQWWKWTAAAVMMGALALAAWQFTGRKAPLPASPATQAERYKNDVMPGSNRASLTLADGSVIGLNEAKEGVLAKQGGTQVSKLPNGRLAYTKPDQVAAVAWNKLSTPRGGQYRVTLPDGTEVWLNAASSLRFPTGFDRKERMVELSGEAYFEVAKDPSKPFIVKTENNMKVKVLGTHFNIMAYPGERSSNVTLLEGTVEVNERLLKPGEQALQNGNGIQVSETDVEHAVAWKNGYFSFSNADITTVMTTLERWYDIEVEYEANVSHLRFGGGIQRSLPLSSVLRILEKNQVKFRIDGRKITVLH